MKNNFLSFVKKESLHILRDVRTMMIVLLIPVVLMILFGFAISTEVNNIDVAIVAPNRTESVRQTVDRLYRNPYFTLTDYIDNNDIDKVLRSGKANVVVLLMRITISYWRSVRKESTQNLQCSLSSMRLIQT